MRVILCIRTSRMERVAGMKKIVCELCDGTEFTKDAGMFVCNGCGTRYSVEEAKSMMKEIEGAAPAVVTPSSAAPVENANQQQIDNILILATTAYEADNYAEAESYCNRAIELDAMCYKAWNLKGKAVGWQSEMGNLRIEEAAHSFCKAIDFAPEEEKEHLKDEAVEELKRLGLALIELRKKRFSDSPDKEELLGFTTDRKVLVDSLLVLLHHGNSVNMPDGYLEQIATKMNEAAVSAFNMARKAWGNIEHPGEKDFDTYLGWNSNIMMLLQKAIDASDDDDEEDITRYENLIIVLKEPMDACSYKREWSSRKSDFIWVKEYSLADAAKANRRKQIAECEQKIASIKAKAKEKEEAEKRKAEEEKKARVDAYWAAHQEEKKQLDAELSDLNSKKKQQESEIADLDKQIKAAKSEDSGSVPSEEETANLNTQIAELRAKKSGLGLFAGKEKKQIDEQIATLEGRVSALKGKVAEEKKVRADEIQKQVKPLQDKVDELNKKKAAAEKRIKAIEAELTKDPEE